jgi:hypothetical protein
LTIETTIMRRTAITAALLVSAQAVFAFEGFGEWRGSAQFLVSRSKESAPSLQEIVPLVVRVDPDGRVTGISTENGCRLSGMAAPFVAGVMKLDITLSGCRSAALNRRYSGSFAHHASEKRASMTLQMIDTLGKPVTSYEVKATAMRR